MENEGVGSLLQLLLLDKDKINNFSMNFFAELQKEQHSTRHDLIDYYKGTRNQLYARYFPQFLIGESFVNIAKFLYL